MAEITSPTIITRINQILDAKVELDDAVQKFNSVSEPSYDDITLLPELWNMFCRYLKLHRHCANPQSVYERELFIFLILTIYSPRTLAGGKMKLGLRDELGKLFGLNAGLQFQTMPVMLLSCIAQTGFSKEMPQD